MPAKLRGEGQDFINSQLALFWRNHNFAKTAIVSERSQFFFEINESWYYMLNLPDLHWGQKPEEYKVKGWETALTY